MLAGLENAALRGAAPAQGLLPSGIINTNDSQAFASQPHWRTVSPLLHVAVAAALISNSHSLPCALKRPLIEHGSQ